MKPKKILIIEDDPITGQIYQARLAQEGLEVEVATDGRSGLYRIYESHPDGVLLDLMLPMMNGVDILKKIRSEAKYQRLPVIAFTNAYVPKLMEDAYGAGATRVLNKAALTPRDVRDALLTEIDAAVRPTAGRTARPPNQARSARLKTPTNPGQSPPVNTGWLGGDDDDYKAEFVETLMTLVSDSLAGMRRSLLELSRARSDEEGLPHLRDLYANLHALSGRASMGGLQTLYEMAGCLEALLRELSDNPDKVNASNLRTIAGAIDAIGEIVAKGADHIWLPLAAAQVLVVDDDEISRRAIVRALEVAGLKADCVAQPSRALTLASAAAFDLILLDVMMPGVNGFELCEQIHSQPPNRSTPILYVTGLTDFKSRARSTLSGGADLVAKPFLFTELAVKALTYVLRGQLAGQWVDRRAA